jgi:predicted metal-binding transcription factor (methanogenesis marker protein 9)
LACSNDNAIKKIIPLLFASYDEELVDFHKRIKNVFIESWGKNTCIGKKIYKAKIRFQKKAYSQERKVNQDNFSEHIEKIKKELNEELMLESE